MANNTTPSKLDFTQTIQRAFEESNDAHRVDLTNVDPSVTINTSQTGLTVLGSFNIPFSSISHTTPYTITSGLTSAAKQILVSDTTGQTDKITFGSSFIFTNPGCERFYNIAIPASTAITIQSSEVSDPVAGSYILTVLG